MKPTVIYNTISGIVIPDLMWDRTRVRYKFDKVDNLVDTELLETARLSLLNMSPCWPSAGIVPLVALLPPASGRIDSMYKTLIEGGHIAASISSVHRGEALQVIEFPGSRMATTGTEEAALQDWLPFDVGDLNPRIPYHRSAVNLVTYYHDDSRDHLHCHSSYSVLRWYSSYSVVLTLSEANIFRVFENPIENMK